MLRRLLPGAGFFESLMMTDELEDVECVAMVLADQFGRAAERLARDYAEVADTLPDMPSAKTWRDIAHAIERVRR
jgi:hypothetical protein